MFTHPIIKDLIYFEFEFISFNCKLLYDDPNFYIEKYIVLFNFYGDPYSEFTTHITNIIQKSTGEDYFLSPFQPDVSNLLLNNKYLFNLDVKLIKYLYEVDILG